MIRRRAKKKQVRFPLKACGNDKQTALAMMTKKSGDDNQSTMTNN